MPFAKAFFSVFYDGENHWFEPGELVPDVALPHISNTTGCLEDEERFPLVYQQMSVQQLRDLAVERELDPMSRKSQLIAQLEEDDAGRRLVG